MKKSSMALSVLGWITSFFVLFSVNITLADVTHHRPTKILFQENEQITVEVSNRDINRLFIAHDKIQSLVYPQGACQEQQDGTGAVLFTALAQSPFTVYVNSRQGHHLAVLIIPRAVIGKTIELQHEIPFHALHAQSKLTHCSHHEKIKV